jgi:hypothetical protein
MSGDRPARAHTGMAGILDVMSDKLRDTAAAHGDD